jgi:arsenite methyltransferase
MTDVVRADAPVTRSAAGPVRLDHDTADLAASYDRVGLPQFEHGKVLLQGLALRPGDRVLDVGCGTGLLGAWAAGRVAPGEVVGIDPLPLRVVLARRKQVANSQAQVGRAEDLSAFADAGFDAVYLNSVLHWVPDQPRALGEALRVLRPGGRIAVNSADDERPHDANRLLGEVLDELGLPHDGAADGGIRHRVSAARLQRLLVEAGFGQVRVRPHTFVDRLHDVDHLIAWSRSSSFGNWLSELDTADHARVRARLAEKLDAQGGRLERHLVHAHAMRP